MAERKMKQELSAYSWWERLLPVPASRSPLAGPAAICLSELFAAEKPLPQPDIVLEKLKPGIDLLCQEIFKVQELFEARNHRDRVIPLGPVALDRMVL